jgi:hypothetical protein
MAVAGIRVALSRHGSAKQIAASWNVTGAATQGAQDGSALKGWTPVRSWRNSGVRDGIRNSPRMQDLNLLECWKRVADPT